MLQNKKVKKKDKVTKLVTAGAVVAMFFVLSYFVFVKDAPLDMQVVFPTSSGTISAGEGLPFKEEEHGAWIWSSPAGIKEESWNEMIAFASEQNITTIYLDINDYTDIYEMTDIRKREEATAGFSDKIKPLIRRASEDGIAVEALAGNNLWGNSSHWYLPLEIVSYVQKYNSTAAPEERFAGIQFDIEPVDQDGFENADQTLIFQEFIALADGISKRIAAESPQLRIGFAIPFWIDNASDRIQPITYNSKRASPGEHIMDVLDQAPLGYIALLDYRNDASGETGSIAHAREEFAYLERTGLSLPIILAQEFTPIDEKPATYFGMERDRILDEIDSLRSAYENSPHFLGIAYHDLPYFKLAIEKG